MAAISSLPFAALRRAADWRPSTTTPAAAISGGVVLSARARRGSRSVVRCVATAGDIPPTVAETKMNFLKSYNRPIPSIYSTVLQELLVQQHLMRYKRTHQYDPVFALGFVTVYEQLMEGYPSNEDRDAIFKSYITALNEDPEQYRGGSRKGYQGAQDTGSKIIFYRYILCMNNIGHPLAQMKDTGQPVIFVLDPPLIITRRKIDERTNSHYIYNEPVAEHLHISLFLQKKKRTVWTCTRAQCLTELPRRPFSSL